MRDTTKQFIGSEFEYEGCTLKVIGFHGRTKGSIALFNVLCSVCNKDKELFPLPFVTTKASLLAGGRPCPCSKSYVYSKEEYKIIIRRYLEGIDKGLKFEGFLGEFKGTRSKMTISYFGEVIDIKPNISNLISGKINFRTVTEPYMGAYVSTEKMIDRLKLSGFYEEGVVYKRLGATKVQHTCKTCSNDIFTQMGLCDGLFIVDHANLIKGSKGCRCNTGILTVPQKEFLFSNICEKEGLEYLGYNKEKDKFGWVCKEDHVNFSVYSNFMVNNSRCSYCLTESSEFRGYMSAYSDREDYIYVLKIKSGKEVFLKVGRSFTPRMRCVRIKGELSEGSTVELLYSARNTHENIFKLEQRVLSKIKQDGVEYKPTFNFNGSTECFVREGLRSVVNFIELNNSSGGCNGS